jgi:dihydroflavonol-4-reductase
MGSDLVLVTGASGFVAGHCILRLLNDVHKVRGTLQSLRRAGEVRQWLTKARGGDDPGDALSFVEAELTDSKSWDAAMDGVRYVLHVASPIPSRTPKDPDDLIVPARDGTLNVMRAASRALVERVVQASSSSANLYGRDNPNDHLFTEADWTDPDHRDNVPYTRAEFLSRCQRGGSFRLNKLFDSRDTTSTDWLQRHSENPYRSKTASDCVHLNHNCRQD